MKKLCYGLLLACSIMFGLSLNGFSDVSALKYSYSAYPLYKSYVYNLDQTNFYSTSNPTFSVWLDSSYISDNQVNSSVASGTYFKRSLQNNICVNDSNSSKIFAYSYVNSYQYYHVWTGDGTGFKRSFNNAICSNNNITSYSYDSIYASKYNLSTGEPEQFVSLNHSLFNSDSPFYSSGSIKRLDIPLNVNHDTVGSIPANVPVSWEFGLLSQQPFPYFDSNLNYSLSLQYFDSTGSVVSDVAICSLNDNWGVGIEVGYLQIIPYWGFKITCTYTPSTSMDYISAQLKIYGGQNDYNPSSFVSYDSIGDVYFYGGYLITNNDDTWSGLSANLPPSGSDITDSPGYSELYPPDYSGCSDGDWFCSLSNLFNFTTLNPFAPMFNLFTDNSSCASIPIIADMLNSEETTYCPWFSSDTRNILTPVLGLAGAMLVFGFFIRWLGSSSGNMFEDQTSHKWSNTQIGQKGAK